MIPIRGTRENMFALGEKARTHDWVDPEMRGWFFEFCGLLCLFGGMAASKSASEDREEARRQICWYLGSLLRNPEQDNGIDIPRSETEFLNSIVWEAIQLYGLNETLREFFPQLQQGENPLFAEDSWPDWWNWAQREFFVEDLQHTT